MDRWAKGQKVGEHTVVRLIGRGGMCEVYEARHELLGESRAIKCLNALHCSNADSRKLFEAEGRLTLRSSKACPDHVVKVLDATRGEDACLVMELLSGEDLNTWAERQRPRGSGSDSRGPRGMAPQQAMDIVDQVAAALNAIHAQGIVHRDIKPANIFVTHDGTGKVLVKLLDFGIAVDLKGGEGRFPQAGTPNYMAPEQKQKAGKLTTQSDVYPFGLLPFFLLTGSDFWPSGDARGERAQKTPAQRVEELRQSGELEREGPSSALPPAFFEGFLYRCAANNSADRPSLSEAAAGFKALFPQSASLRKIPEVTELVPDGDSPPDIDGDIDTDDDGTPTGPGVSQGSAPVAVGRKRFGPSALLVAAAVAAAAVIGLRVSEREGGAPVAERVTTTKAPEEPTSAERPDPSTGGAAPGMAAATESIGAANVATAASSRTGSAEDAPVTVPEKAGNQEGDEALPTVISDPSPPRDLPSDVTAPDVTAPDVPSPPPDRPPRKVVPPHGTGNPPKPEGTRLQSGKARAMDPSLELAMRYNEPEEPGPDKSGAGPPKGTARVTNPVLVHGLNYSERDGAEGPVTGGKSPEAKNP